MYCPNCGAQNADSSKFCMKCGKALVLSPMQSSGFRSVVPQPQNKLATVAKQPAETAKLIGGLAGIAGGAISIVGWLMPWSNAVLVTLSGLQFMLGALTGSIAALGMLQYSNASWILVFLGLLVAIVYALIPILAISCIRTGVSMFEHPVKTTQPSMVRSSLDQLRSRSKGGITVVILIVAVPLLLGALLTMALPFLAVFSQLGNLLPNGGYGAGLFMSAGGFVLAYVSARIARAQMDASDVTIDDASSFNATSQSLSAATSASVSTVQNVTDRPSLTDIEKQVLSGLVQGLGERDIALRTELSDSTVSRTISDLYTKFNATSRSELVVQAKQNQLV